MNQFTKFNNYIGWGVFLIASFVYLSTIEQTVSFWDCGEYIATAYKLEVGHPPGAPLFQLFGRIFSLFASQGSSEVAIAINIMSALCSSFTILFLFWTITAFGRKIFSKKEETDIETGKIIAILGSGAIGALAYTFSDSFWFSAVEGEVYAMSSLFTAVTFWCIMKWEREADKPQAGRWLVLIGYLIGLSIGVHLLSLLTIPAMGMIYYFKKYPYTKKGAVQAFLISMLVLGLVQGVIIPGAVSLISKFELFFVNTIGLPFNSGTIIYFLAIIGAITYGLIYTKKHKKPIWNTAILGVMMLLIGYSSFAILVIRSNANPPIDENNPEDAVSLLSYLKREQYGSWPIVYGQHFNAKLDSREPYIDGNPIYAKSEKKGKYIVIDQRKNTVPNYSKKDKMFFPRIWSATQTSHAGGYVNWAGLKNKDVNPTFAENLTFFFRYQIGWSYLRYFMWNFVGRQNDNMNMDGNSLNGNWESGVGFIDRARLGTPSSDVLMPDYLANNKGKNHYFFLPLILGLIGMLFHFKKNNQDALSVLLFFLFTGVLIIVYLNVVPFQPRERDYAYVGSFYAFSIWIGLGVLALYDFIGKHLDSKKSAILATTISVFIPALMAAENWNDHDRSGRSTALEVAKNYLNSCDKNAILFTNGDNDTFPLWYAQEVEGIRTDIKVVNLSLFNTDWYIDQMKRASYDAAPIPSSLEHDDYRTGTRDYTPIQERFKEYIEVKDVVNFINSNSPKAKLNTSAGLRNYCPTKKLKLTVNKEIAKTFVPEEYHSEIKEEIRFKLKGSGIFKNKLLVLDILANFNWERPVYFAITVGRDNYMGLEKYFQLEGLAYRLVPYSASSVDGQTGIVHTEKMYERLMTKFQWGGLNNPNLYFDETNTRMVMNFRNNYARLAESLYQKGEKEKAIKVLDKCINEFPSEVVALNYFSIPIIDLYHKLGETEKGNEILANMIDDQLKKINYLKEFNSGSGLKQDIGITGQILGSLARVLQIHKLEDASYNYSEEDGVYYKEKDGSKESIDFKNYRINTFMDEYLSMQ
ncbi:MAG: DUF2723 domain-containing protein [Bacteroidota bacterium]|nr:DUF2723 domain-containing protein [Bacteroidota bacterium]